MSHLQGQHESIKNICGKYDIQTYFKGNRTLKNILVSPKDKEQQQKWDYLLVQVPAARLQ